MLTPTVFTGLAIFWLLCCALVIWLAWRAARRDAQAQRDAERSDTPSSRTKRTDRAA